MPSFTRPILVFCVRRSWPARLRLKYMYHHSEVNTTSRYIVCMICERSQLSCNMCVTCAKILSLILIHTNCHCLIANPAAKHTSKVTASYMCGKIHWICAQSPVGILQISYHIITKAIPKIKTFVTIAV